MSELTIIELCRVLVNITRNRCRLVENSNPCQCMNDIIDQSMMNY